MTDERKDVGTTALVYEPPVIEIAGREYKLRRLGIVDTLRLAKILAAGVAGLGHEIGNLDTLDPQVLGMLILAGAPFAEQQVLDFLGGIIGVSVADMRDPERFPMGSELQIIEKLVEHEDVRAFLQRLRGLTKVPALRSLLQTSSTSSSPGTGGQTETSSPSPTPDSSRPSKQPRGGKEKKGEIE